MRCRTVTLSLVMTVLLAALPGHGSAADCRECHAGGGDAAPPDVSAFYLNPAQHHPIGVVPPEAGAQAAGFNVPTGVSGELRFFDTNADGVPDPDEIRVFGEGGGGLVDCASCHREHEAARPAGSGLPVAYLRIANADSRLCLTCHRR